MQKRTNPPSVLVAAIVAAALVVIGCGGSSGSGLFVGDGGQDGPNNPPGCPSTTPRNGEACSAPEGTRCDFGCPQGGPASATCTGQRWSVAQSAISCEAPDAGPPPAPAPFACGSKTCSTTQYCVVPCCGGGPPQCVPLPDSGVCPAGAVAGTCPLDGQPGCIEGFSCTPPPPYCVDDPKEAQACFPFSDSSKPRELDCTCE